MPAKQSLRFHEDQGAASVGHDRGEHHHDQPVPDSKARRPDVSRGDEELLAKERVLGEELHLGARKIRKETTTGAAGLAGRRCESRLDPPASPTANATEDLTHVLPDSHQLSRQ